MIVTGFQGTHKNISHTASAVRQLPKVELKMMAEKALKYLYSNPLPEYDYQCRFSFAPSKWLPFCPDLKINGYLDPITEGDTEARNDVAFRMVREMTGDWCAGAEIEEKVHQRLISYIKQDGFGKDVCWTHEYSNASDNPEIFISLWCTPMLLHNECLRFRQGVGDLSLCRRLFEGMEALCIRENGRAYYRYGMAHFNEHAVSGGYKGHYPVVFSGLCEYWLVSGDERCWELMTELAEGFVCDLQPDHLHREDGGIDGHNHVQLHAIRGMAQFAYLSGEPRYLSWIKAIYDFYRRWALDTGWLPEIRDWDVHCNHSETCLNGDMFETALWLALAGYDDLWDQLERSLRNYFCVMQFELNDRFRNWYRDVHADKTPEQIAEAMEILKDLEGGFISAMTPNDYVFDVYPESNHFGHVNWNGKEVAFDMMGCCPPEGMRAIYYAWKYAQQTDENGVTVYLPIDSESSEAKVISLLPNEGKLSVQMKVAGALRIRVPAWADRGQVQLKVNGESCTVAWGGTANRYVSVCGLLPGDEVTVTYPLVEFDQTVTVNYCGWEPQEYCYHWIGNTVASVKPEGKYLPLYQQA